MIVPVPVLDGACAVIPQGLRRRAPVGMPAARLRSILSALVSSLHLAGLRLLVLRDNDLANVLTLELADFA